MVQKPIAKHKLICLFINIILPNTFLGVKQKLQHSKELAVMHTSHDNYNTNNS